MGSEKEFLEYANECFEWAKTARTDQERGIFLQMANSWTAAALLAKQPPPQSTKDKDQNATGRLRKRDVTPIELSAAPNKSGLGT
jgi:hypothetical protein